MDFKTYISFLPADSDASEKETAKQAEDGMIAAMANSFAAPFKTPFDPDNETVVTLIKRYKTFVIAAGLGKRPFTRYRVAQAFCEKVALKLNQLAATETEAGKKVQTFLGEASDAGMFSALWVAFPPAAPNPAHDLHLLFLAEPSRDFKAHVLGVTEKVRSFLGAIKDLPPDALSHEVAVATAVAKYADAYRAAYPDPSKRNLDALVAFCDVFEQERRATETQRSVAANRNTLAGKNGSSKAAKAQGKDDDKGKGANSKSRREKSHEDWLATRPSKPNKACYTCKSLPGVDPWHWKEDCPRRVGGASADAPAPAPKPLPASPPLPPPPSAGQSTATRKFSPSPSLPGPPASNLRPGSRSPTARPNMAKVTWADEEEQDFYDSDDEMAANMAAVQGPRFAPDYYVNGLVGTPDGATTSTQHIFLDSGARYATAHHELVKSLGLTATRAPTPIQYFNADSAVSTLTHCVDLQIIFCKQRYVIRAYVSHTHPFVLSLGRNDMAAHGLKEDVIKNELKLTREDNKKVPIHKRQRGQELPAPHANLLAVAVGQGHTAFEPAVVPTKRAAATLVLPGPQLLALERGLPFIKAEGARARSVTQVAKPHLASPEETLPIRGGPAVTRAQLAETIDPTLMGPDRELLLDTLHKHERIFVGPANTLQLGRALHVEHTMPMTPEVDQRPPVLKMPHQHLSPLDYALVRAWTEEGLQHGRIELADSAKFISRLVLVRTFQEALKELKTRICWDLRQPNKFLIRLPYPQKHTFAVLERLRGAKILGKIDLKAAYEQIPLAERDRSKATYYHAGRLYRSRVMVFGDANAPFTMQEYIERVLAHCHDVADALLDDVLIHSDVADMATFCAAVDSVLTALEEHELHLNLPKCRFGYRQIDALGHLVSGNSVSIPSSRVERITSLPPPPDRTTLHSQLQMMNFYRRFILGYADIVAPLTDLLSPKVEWTWLPAVHGAAWQRLLEAFTSPPILAQPLPGLPYVLRTDASGRAAGYALFQLQEGVWRLIGGNSHKFNKAGQNYSATSRELTAVVNGLKYYRYLLQGANFSLETDHQALQQIISKEEFANSRIAEAIVYIQIYGPIKVAYRKGRSPEMALPDALSRALEHDEATATSLDPVSFAALDAPTTSPSLAAPVAAPLPQFSLEALQAAQRSDPVLCHLIAALEEGASPEDQGARKVWDLHSSLLFLNEGTLYIGARSHSRGPPGALLVVPSTFRQPLLAANHDTASAGHFKGTKFLGRLLTHYWWPTMAKDAVQHEQACLACAEVNPARPQATGILQARHVGYPGKEVTIDFLVLPKTERGNTCALVSIDKFTGWAEAEPFEAQTSASTLSALQRWFTSEDFPQQVTSDNARAFLTEAIAKFLKLHGTTMGHTPVLHPQSNPAERLVQNIKIGLRKELEMHSTDWDLKLPHRLRAINSTPTRPLGGLSPFNLRYGRNPISPLDRQLGRTPPDVTPEQHFAAAIGHGAEARARTTEAREQVRKEIQAQLDQRAIPSNLKVGDWCMLARADSDIKTALDPRFDGPFPVTGQGGRNELIITTHAGPYKAHVSRLKRFDGPAPSSPHLGEADPDEWVEVPKPPNLTPASLIGQRVRVYWSRFKEWRDGVVTGQDKKRSLVTYFTDKQEYWERLLGSAPPPWILLGPRTVPTLPEGGGVLSGVVAPLPPEPTAPSAQLRRSPRRSLSQPD